jgi:pyruvate ferredoxin oxidoreductase alpha subunit
MQSQRSQISHQSQRSQKFQTSQSSQQSQSSQFLEGSRAIAETIKLIKPAVISAYPITPQTHIVEDLAKFKADGELSCEYIQAESEFAAASIVLGASATGVRVYTATSSQGLLLMAEVIFNIAGMRLPVVLTCANRAVSAPINIWNDSQDVMTIRDAGWLLFFAENNQEAVDLHLLAYKIAEQINLPVMVNVDGFVLTHTWEPVEIPEKDQVNKFLPKYNPPSGTYLDPANPKTFGAFATPAYYMEIRQELQDDLIASKKIIKNEFQNFKKTFGRSHDLVEYYGPKNAKTVLVAMGSVVGTMKEAIEEINFQFPISNFQKKVGILKITCFRPFPNEEILKFLKPARYVAVLDKSISLGAEGVLASEIKAACFGKTKAKIQSFIIGLGGRDVTKEMVGKIVKIVQGKDEKMRFVGK